MLGDFESSENCFEKYYGTYLDGKTIGIINEFKSLNLLKAIADYRNNSSQKFPSLPEPLVKSMFRSILSTFAKLESFSIYHCNIASFCFVTDDKWSLKLIDFSTLAFDKSDKAELDNVTGTDGYMAPELQELFYKGIATSVFSRAKADVFSAGLVLLNIITLKNIKGLNNVAKTSELNGICCKLPFKWAKNILQNMLEHEPQSRMNFASLLKMIH